MNPVRQTLLLSGMCSLMACAHVRSADAVPKESAAMTSNTPEVVHTLDQYPELTPEGLGRRFLKYLDTLHTKEQLTPEFLEQQMGVKLTPWERGGNFTMQLPDRQYGLSYYKVPNVPNSEVVILSFSPTSFQGVEDMTPVCSMDFDAYRVGLEQIGYKDTGRADYDHTRRLPVYYYARDKVNMAITVRGESETVFQHLCVNSIHVGVWD